ncbi:PRC-barrel domain-containing protein [Paracraurococcus lichenis]|uniref:PRC-barrel domain-containing protein n=1 Tax=Paracraurococcus lichenis TaxID=3064888 RepID=A0ABT9E331_9PROT|nr:PRC-barrel domain-containing protein [Paracraurococcus sp. LOR1-02]MDO9710566.1 PRC-barrel domain-containing protein [Paracraurococcus sp. LOR1-02]
MSPRQRLLSLTAAALLGAPTLGLAQGSSGSSMMPQTTQTGPQQGPLSGTPGARAGANAGQATGQQIQGDNAGSPTAGGAAPDRQTPPNMRAQGQPAGPQSRSADSRDGTPAPNPPSAANTGTASPANAGSAPSGANTARSATAAGATTGALAVDSAALRNGRRASKLIGSSVYNENNESIGEVDDIIIPPGGSGPVAVISVGGFLGIGAKLVAVPYDRLQSAGSGNRWTLTGATKESLGSLPTFTYDNTAEKRG